MSLLLNKHRKQTKKNLRLTPRENDVFALLMQNMPLKTIALELGITLNTVNSHYRSIDLNEK